MMNEKCKIENLIRLANWLQIDTTNLTTKRAVVVALASHCGLSR